MSTKSGEKGFSLWGRIENVKSVSYRRGNLSPESLETVDEDESQTGPAVGYIVSMVIRDSG